MSKLTKEERIEVIATWYTAIIIAFLMTIIVITAKKFTDHKLNKDIVCEYQVSKEQDNGKS